MDDDHGGRVGSQALVQGGDHVTELCSAALGAVAPGGEVLELDAEGSGDPGRHLLVVVLTGVNDQGVGTEQVDDRGELD